MPRPTDDLRRTLTDADLLRRQGERVTRAQFTGLPMVVWGLVWVIDVLAFAWLPSRGAYGVCAVAGVVALLVTVAVRRRGVRTGRETRQRAAWAAVLLSSPVLVTLASPLPEQRLIILVAGLWSLGVVLHGIATADLPVVGLGVALLASCLAERLIDTPVAFAVLGVGGGALMAGFGGVRAWGARTTRRPVSTGGRIDG